jgi:hypothetical protein
MTHFKCYVSFGEEILGVTFNQSGAHSGWVLRARHCACYQEGTRTTNLPREARHKQIRFLSTCASGNSPK